MNEFRAVSGADMYPASRCGHCRTAGPSGVRGSAPDQRRKLEGRLLHSGLRVPSHDCCARRLVALARRISLRGAGLSAIGPRTMPSTAGRPCFHARPFGIS